MNATDAIFDRIAGFGAAPAVYRRGRTVSYRELQDEVDAWAGRLAAAGIAPGKVCAMVGEFSPGTCSLFLALMKMRAIILPVARDNETELEAQLSASGAERLIRFDADDAWRSETLRPARRPPLVETFAAGGRSGLILFTSGTTDKPKGILHDLDQVNRKFLNKRRAWRTVLFLMIDHFGGINTLLGVFAYGGMAVCLDNRSVEHVCETIEKAGATLLPTTPTFLNFLLGSTSVDDYDLSSIERISYGTEVMPELTLKSLARRFPNARIVNTYGLSELGVLRSKSKSSDSAWIKVGGEGFATKVVDGMLWIRSESRMVGYLDEPQPFDDEGWMCTGDRIEVDGEYIRFLGRQTDLISVGGEKVSPQEVEAVILGDANVLDATVYGIPNPLFGRVVVSDVTLRRPEDPEQLSERLRALCAEHLRRHKVPARFRIVDADRLHTARFKKPRQRPPA